MTRRRRKTVTLRVVGTSLLVMALIGAACVRADANPFPDPGPPAQLLSKDELLSHLDNPESGVMFWWAVSQATRLGPEYVWILEKLLANPKATQALPIMRVTQALGRIGTASAIAALRGAVADTNLSALCRADAAEGLAEARDTASIPLLREIAAGGGDPMLTNGVGQAADWLEHPERYWPLLGVADGQVYVGFLRDDIALVTYRKHPGETLLTFRPDEYVPVCRLLLAGTPRTVYSMETPYQLVFRLRNGREARLSTDGTLFSYSGSWGLGGGNGFTVECPALGEFISMCLREPRSSRGESSN
jgi:hypothetical protein